MIYVLVNTINPTAYFRTENPRAAVDVARRWQEMNRFHAIEVVLGGNGQPLRTIRVPLSTNRATIAAIRAAQVS